MANAWLICREPVHIGGADSDSRGNQNPVFRLPDRSPAIPGSSLRGALREDAQNEKDQAITSKVREWFGGENAVNDTVSPGGISIGWCWPLWWPLHVLGYGNWWVSCPAWLKRYEQQVPGVSLPGFNAGDVYTTDANLANQTVYLRWLKLTNLQTVGAASLPKPAEIPNERLLIVPDASIVVMVDMGMVRQPRVSLRDQADANGNLVQNLFGVEGYQPGAVFHFTWTTRGQFNSEDLLKTFLEGEHHVGGLWGVGYGRVEIKSI